MTETLRDQLAWAMYLADFEAENLPGAPRDLDELATKWDSLRNSSGRDGAFIADSYYELADRMIAHWDRHADQETLANCLTTRRQHELDAGVGSEE